MQLDSGRLLGVPLLVVVLFVRVKESGMLVLSDYKFRV